jgi:hypothetical protein
MAAATKPPAMMAGHDTAETGGDSASTMTVSTMRTLLMPEGSGQDATYPADAGCFINHA